MVGLFDILSSKPIFAIHPDVGNQMIESLELLFNKQISFSPELFATTPTPISMIEVDHSGTAGQEPSHRSHFAHIPIHGVLFSQDQSCGPKGQLSIASDVTAAADDPNIAGLLLDIQSPGGQVLGNGELCNAIAYARSRKPVLAYVKGQASSAAYKAAMQADYIMMNNPDAQVGSIGVMLKYRDNSAKQEKDGMRVVSVVSNYSPEKAAINFEGATDDDIDAMRTQLLDPLALNFIEAVKSRRPNVNPKALRGASYYTQEALQMGLADAQGTIQDAISWLIDAAQKQNHTTSNTMFGSNKNEVEALRAQHAEALTTQRAEFDTRIAEMKEEYETTLAAQVANAVQASEEKLAEALADKLSLKDELAAAQAKIEDLAKTPVNEVADAQGNEAAPVVDANDDLPNPAPIWNGFFADDLKDR